MSGGGRGGGLCPRTIRDRVGVVYAWSWERCIGELCMVLLYTQIT